MDYFASITKWKGNSNLSDMNRNKKLLLNTIMPLLVQILTVVSGLILPILRLEAYGSEANGLINSVAKFLSLISFLDFGVGAVVRSSLYKPLADNNKVAISQIVTSAQIFFRKIAMVLLVYIAVLCMAYPFVVDTNFGHIYIVSLIIAISISSFSQYYFGIVDSLLLSADQRGYIQYLVYSITIVLNLVLSVLLIGNGATIQIVMFTTSFVYLIRPVFIRLYVNKKYNINRREYYSDEPIKQKWNGMAQHIASVVLDETDTIVLTTFASLTAVSIYSVYQMIVLNVKTLFLSAMSGIQAVMGEYWAKQKMGELNVFFGNVEWIVHTLTVLIFGCMSVLLVPFISVYTRNITDANYYQPLFCYLIVFANAGHCLRLPYNTMILAAGQFKETQKNYIVAAILNLSISIITVKIWGLIGVAIGTLIAMVYQTLWMANYLSRNVLKWPLKNFIKQVCVDIITLVLGVIATFGIKISHYTFGSWCIVAIISFFIWSAIVLLINAVLYRDKVSYYKTKILNQRRS